MDNREHIAFTLWKADAMRAMPNVGVHRTPEQFATEADDTRYKWLSLADAVLAELDNLTVAFGFFEDELPSYAERHGASCEVLEPLTIPLLIANANLLVGKLKGTVTDG